MNEDDGFEEDGVWWLMRTMRDFILTIILIGMAVGFIYGVVTHAKNVSKKAKAVTYSSDYERTDRLLDRDGSRYLDQ